MKEDKNLLNNIEDKNLLNDIREEMRNPKPKEIKKQPSKLKSILIKLGLIVTVLVIDTILIIILIGRVVAYCKLIDVRVQIPIQAKLVPVLTVAWVETKEEAPTSPNQGGQEKRKTPEEKDAIIQYYGLYKIVKTISILESNNGTNPQGHHTECSNDGKYNDFGYFPNGDRSFCFDSYEENVEAVTKMFYKNLQTMTLPQALCYYNEGAPGGLIRSDCDYSRNFYKIGL